MLDTFEKGLNGETFLKSELGRELLSNPNDGDIHKDKVVEVVVVSCDVDEPSMREYLSGNEVNFAMVPFASRSRLKRRYGCWAGGDAAHPELKGAERRHPGIPTCLLVKNGGRINGDFDVKQDVIDAVRTGDVKKLVAKWERL